MSLAFVFPGQGSQKVGHGARPGRGLPGGRAVFAEADEALGFAALAPLLRGAGGRAPAHRQHPARHPGHERGRAARAGRARHRAGLGGRPQPGRIFGAGGRGRADAARTRWRRCAGAASTCRRRCRWAKAPWPPSSPSTFRRSKQACREAAQGQVVAPANINSPGPGRDRRPRRGRGARHRSSARRRGPSAPSACPCPRPSTAR